MTAPILKQPGKAAIAPTSPITDCGAAGSTTAFLAQIAKLREEYLNELTDAREQAKRNFLR